MRLVSGIVPVIGWPANPAWVTATDVRHGFSDPLEAVEDQVESERKLVIVIGA